MRPTSVVSIEHLLTNDRMIFLAGDHGLEHGPEDFTEQSIDPNYLYDIAIKAGLNAVVFGRGIAERYHAEYVNQIPLIVKLNGHTRFNAPHSYGLQNCTVPEALSFGAAAVGYTLHMGGIHEAEQIREVGVIVREAHTLGLPVVLWVTPRGPEITDPSSGSMVAYAARTGMELGADIVAVYNPHNDESALRWAGKCAGKTRVVICGGDQVSIEDYQNQCRGIIKADLDGVVVGRNIWRAEDAMQAAGMIKSSIYDGQ
jgi:fructose-bisphosphate aldolase, class I